MSQAPGPIVMLADSQLLFAKQGNDWFQQKVAGQVSERPDFGVYIGASNHNEPAFYEMASEAMKDFGVQQTLFLRTGLEDLAQYRDRIPSIILLSGGDVAAGWALLKQPSIARWLVSCFQQGSLLLGISAGAIHLTNGLPEGELPASVAFFNLFNSVTLAHEEADNWPGEQRYLQGYDQQLLDHDLHCLKIPFGGGVWIQEGAAALFGKRRPELTLGRQVVALPFEPVSP